MPDRFFPYRLDQRYRPLLIALRVSDRDGVTLTDDGRFIATYGPKTLETTIDNIDHTDIAGPYRWWTSVGLRLSLADDGLTMGTNPTAGLCVGFVERVPKVIGLKDHSALTVTVADPAGLRDAIGR